MITAGTVELFVLLLIETFHCPTTSVIFTVLFVIVEGSMTGTGGGGGEGVTITLSVMKSEY